MKPVTIIRVIAVALGLGAVFVWPAVLIDHVLPSAYRVYRADYLSGFAILRFMLIGGCVAGVLYARSIAYCFHDPTQAAAANVPPPRDASWRIGLILITVAAFAIRLFGIGSSFTSDEVFLVKSIITREPVRAFVHPSGSAHTLHSLLSWLVTRVAGVSEWSVRLPAMVLGAASAPLAFLVVARRFGTWSGLAAGLLLAVTPIHIWYSQMAKGNAPLVFFVLLSWLLLQALTRAWTPWRSVGYLLVLVAAGLCHLSGTVFVIGQGVALIAAPRAPDRASARPEFRLRMLGLHLVGLYIIFLLHSVVAPLIFQAGETVTGKEGTINIWAIMGDTFHWYTALDMHPVWLIPGFIAFGIGVWRLLRDAPDMLLLAVVPFLVSIAMTATAGLFSHVRYHMFFLPGLVLILAVGLTEGVRMVDGRRRWFDCAAVLTLVIFMGAAYAGAAVRYFEHPRSNLKAVAEYLAEHGEGAHVYIAGLNYSGYPVMGLTHYLKNFEVDESLSEMLATVDTNAVVYVGILDPNHFQSSYWPFYVYLQARSRPVAVFECLGVLDQHRVKESMVYRLSIDEFRDGMGFARPRTIWGDNWRQTRPRRWKQ
jgi:hypothetical protein